MYLLECREYMSLNRSARNTFHCDEMNVPGDRGKKCETVHKENVKTYGHFLVCIQ
jgi:hypothetical protein